LTEGVLKNAQPEIKKAIDHYGKSMKKNVNQKSVNHPFRG
tara:strand:+ start:18513 stop:18632 length:120 start_codon:yes stop_codon:yes gene_type:complete